MINNVESDGAEIDGDILDFVMSHNILPKASGYSPLEVLKGEFFLPSASRSFLRYSLEILSFQPTS